MEPPLPISLRIGVLYSGDVSARLMSFINSHIQSCRLNCEDQTCTYFKWFCNHNRTCKEQNSCFSCSKLKKWVGLHIGCCHTPSRCPLDHLCGDMKKMKLKDSFLERDKCVEDVLNLSGGVSGHHRNRITSESLSQTAQYGNDTTGYENGIKSLGTGYQNGIKPRDIGYENGMSSPSTGYENGFSHELAERSSGLSFNSVEKISYTKPSQPDKIAMGHLQRSPSPSRSPSSYQDRSDASLSTSPLPPPPPPPPPPPRAPSISPRNSLNFPQGTLTSLLPPPQGNHTHLNSYSTKSIELYPQKPVQLPSPSRDMPPLPASLHSSFEHPNGPDFFKGPASFYRRASNSSTASYHSREKVRLVEDRIRENEQQYLGGGGGGGGGEEGSGVREDHMTPEQQRDFIQQLNSSFRRWSEDENVSCELTSQASFGDAGISRLDSLLESLSHSGSGSGFSSSSPESSLRFHRDSVASEESRNGKRSPRSRNRRMKTHRLEKMYNVNSFDGPPAATAVSPLPGSSPIQRRRSSAQLHTSPSTAPDSPPVHRPIQRQGSEGIRKYVRGLGNSLTRTSNGSPLFRRSPQQILSDEEEELAGTNQGMDDDSDQIGFPVQRSESISNGNRDKLLLARLSITKEHYQKLRELQYRHSAKSNHHGDHVHTQHSHTHHHDDHTHKLQQPNRLHSKRNSYDSETSSASPSLSSNCSAGSNSQYSSLEDSSDTGESLGSGKFTKDPSAQIGSFKEPILDHTSSVNKRVPSLDGHTPSGDSHTPSTISCGGSGNDFSLASSKSCSTPMSPNLISLSQDHLSSRGCTGYTPLSHLPEEKTDQFSNSEQCCHRNDEYCSHGDNSHEVKVLDPHIFASPTDSDGSEFFSDTHSGSYHDYDDEDNTILDKDDCHHLQYLPPAPHHSGVTKEEMEKIYSMIDGVKEKYKDDIEVMKNRGKLIREQSVEGCKKEEDDKVPGSIIQWDKESDGYLEPSNFSKLEAQYYRKMMEPVDERQIAVEEVSHREHLREYLLGQFHRKQVYREGVHWNRQTKLGRGGQGTCFSILDKETNLSLALKEESENDKSMDEAYVCLKFAHEMNVSRNIVEYFGAALLPRFNMRTVQLFMEIMPTCMQAYLFKNGPLLMTDVHHFSFQLFDALEYLHNREGIIHCDIKPANLLLDYTAQRMKLADFGAARLLEEKRQSSDGDLGAGTLAYNPPEHYSHQQCTFALDSWQAGCCVLAMATGRRPWRHLFMDPSPMMGKSLQNKLKREYGVLIGNGTNGHMLPAFLDSTITKLLYGCMNSDPSMRLTAIECQQLLAFSEDLNEEQKLTVSDAIGYPSATPPILQSYSCSMAAPRVDVFLGSFYQQIPVNGHSHTLYPGWVGSVQVFAGMTYEDLYHVICSSSVFPVLRHLGYLDIASWGSSPQVLFVTTNPSQSPSPHPFLPINRRLLVDNSKHVVLYQPS